MRLTCDGRGEPQGPVEPAGEVTRRQARHRAEGASQLEPGNMWNRKCLVCQHHVCLRRLESLRTSHRSWSSCQQASIPVTERADVTCRRLPEREYKLKRIAIDVVLIYNM